MDQMEAKVHSTTSADGTVIGYRQLGQGPGLILVHGGMKASQHYLHLAKALSGSYTVYIPDRRGRGLSGSVGEGYRMAKECEDIDALLKQTGAAFLFGHSSGGLIALEAALELPFAKLAVYEPALSIDGSIRTDWVPSFESAIHRNEILEALFIALEGINLVEDDDEQHHQGDQPADPEAAKEDMQRQIRELSELVPTFSMDIALVKELESDYRKYAGIKADTLLLGGGRSPEFLRHALGVLGATLPDAKHIEFQGLNHNAPDEHAPEQIAKALREFFN